MTTDRTDPVQALRDILFMRPAGPVEKTKNACKLIEAIENRAREALSATPALRPPQPGVVTEELRRHSCNYPDCGCHNEPICCRGVSIPDGKKLTYADGLEAAARVAEKYETYEGNPVAVMASQRIAARIRATPAPAAETAPDAGLVEALKFYADNWRGNMEGDGSTPGLARLFDSPTDELLDDQGERARAALSRAGER